MGSAVPGCFFPSAMANSLSSSDVRGLEPAHLRVRALGPLASRLRRAPRQPAATIGLKPPEFGAPGRPRREGPAVPASTSTSTFCSSLTLIQTALSVRRRAHAFCAIGGLDRARLGPRPGRNVQVRSVVGDDHARADDAREGRLVALRIGAERLRFPFTLSLAPSKAAIQSVSSPRMRTRPTNPSTPAP